MEDKTTVTIKAVKEALDFIENLWGDWDGDLHDFVANIISEDTVTQYDVQHLLDALAQTSMWMGLRLSMSINEVQSIISKSNGE